MLANLHCTFNFVHSDVRQDFTIYYAFIRVTDDIIDEEHDVQSKRQQRMHVICTFLDQLFSNRRITSEYCWEMIVPQPKIDWPYFEGELTNEQLCVFRALSRIAYYLPQEPFYELMHGYAWDIAKSIVRNESDLIEYSKYVTSSGGTLCTFVLCQKSYQWPDRMGPKCRFMFENIQKLGVVGFEANEKEKFLCFKKLEVMPRKKKKKYRVRKMYLCICRYFN